MQALAAWNDAAPGLVGLIGRTGLPPTLDAALGALAPFDLSCAFAYPGEQRPLLLHDNLGGVAPPEIMRNYLSGTYLLDAVYSACLRGAPEGLHRLSELAPDEFFGGDYYNSPDVHPCISMETGSLAEEIVFLATPGDGLYVAYSLLRQAQSGAFSKDEFARLAAAAPLATALMRQHWRTLAPPQPAPRIVDGEAVVERAFRTFAPAELTPREQTIVSLILRGHSSLSIGNNLAIAEGTVKIHRKHIYAKLGISSQTELFNLFVRHILAERV
ncbi:helix-turn-helix transcriptional regulator [Methylopila musalis]|uniref:Helix-turn-helix transcriptional regulator n=1 Tax=Methylopila musalis TaxID=1134781 RepID=A0ABW3ZAB7_9HYPH